ncbi:RelA/SpoT domain-containing protein [Pseudomonas sp. P7779]|uniref:RelA/SpoT domain-containing protein n=1 Tax=Pseudomonas sp. P7779 TaxID=2738832 RepID=UPI0015BF3258|nr:RelA/SpoT domain-containing protein [Pseudomonas sp. P7779]NWC99243.1 RelA/SpoT domain-containing protein [Pseudomonas sp. P7779]
MNRILTELYDSREAAIDFANIATHQLNHILAINFPSLVDPQHSIVWRIKSENATRLKAESRKGVISINDFIGIRVLVLHTGALSQVESTLKEWEDQLGLKLTQRNDYFSNPAPGGYRAIHRDYKLQDYSRWSLSTVSGVELQITTWLQHVHSLLSHSCYYKNPNIAPEKNAKILADFSNKIHELDSTIADIYSSLKT